MSRTVVVVGGGYGGTAVAKALEAEADVVLIDPRDAFVNVAGSLRALTRPDWAGTMFFPFDTVLTRARVIRDRAVSVDPGGVTLASGQRVTADYLVLATGSGYAYPARPTADSVAEALDDLRRTNKELVGAGRVLILGAGPVGLELAGEIKEAWPDKHVMIVDPAEQLLPGFKAEMREDLHRQLDELGIEVRLGTSLATPLTTEANRAATCTATTTDGDEITADIWFRAYGVHVNSDYLADGRLTTLTAQGQVPVTETLNVRGTGNVLDHVYAIGDLTDVAEDKMAAYALRHAEVVAQNIVAHLRGEQPTATYQPMSDPMILVPLGSRHGVGQMPTPDGPAVVPAATVSEYKGVDLFTGRFTEQFGPTAA
ncbi:NAD(P)/FAD-dependent oxidoreductase [Micromonospora lupini]|uniref:Putative FAD-dependent pyridine nucleotide-disulphide oxidoreductase n=1 Tax=Micromonospora lupini str. Lupac 08 TaxID=1150864 RepID=I0KVF6_9ACTN|nr:FAD-dependent oxidoreductase [Micromonospora lupini]CCH15553.1 Putative FAD-dependent pyridine nucleotide-disulphide oxidoreductase [Micromonospora lupini str. Lupac 08]